jgi:hypothetical protein
MMYSFVLSQVVLDIEMRKPADAGNATYFLFEVLNRISGMLQMSLKHAALACSDVCG